MRGAASGQGQGNSTSTNIRRHIQRQIGFWQLLGRLGLLLGPWRLPRNLSEKPLGVSEGCQRQVSRAAKDTPPSRVPVSVRAKKQGPEQKTGTLLGPYFCGASGDFRASP